MGRGDIEFQHRKEVVKMAKEHKLHELEVYESYPSEVGVSDNMDGRLDVVIWEPLWTVDVGCDCKVGITVDDSCFMVLSQNMAGQWRPSTHIPIAAARFLGELAEVVIGD